MVQYSIDRIEGDIAVLIQNETGEALEISVGSLPSEAKEADILRYDGSSYFVDQIETERTKKENSDRLRSLFNRK